jgi:MADS-box transcription factor
MLGENLSVLTVPDLLLLEQQLDMGVSRIRAKKNQLLLEEIDNLRRKERDLQQVNEELRQKALELQQLADASEMAEAVARALPLVGQGQITTLASHEPGGSSQTPRVYPTHPNLQDPQTSQTSLHLGLFSETFPRRSSGQMSEQSQVEAEGSSIGLHTSQWM